MKVFLFLIFKNSSKHFASLRPAPSIVGLLLGLNKIITDFTYVDIYFIYWTVQRKSIVSLPTIPGELCFVCEDRQILTVSGVLELVKGEQVQET